MGKFSDPTLYLQNNQYQISDRLIYNKLVFEMKNFQLLPLGFCSWGGHRESAIKEN